MAIKYMCKWLAFTPLQAWKPAYPLYMQGQNNLHEYTGLSFGDTDPYKSWNGRTGGNTPAPLLNSDIESYVITDLLWHLFMDKSFNSSQGV